jgi:hypothetical protein
MSWACEIRCFSLPKDQEVAVVFSRAVQLPFPPFPGLSLWGVTNPDSGGVRLKEVSFDVRDGEFECSLPDDPPRRHTLQQLEDIFGPGWAYEEAPAVQGEPESEA